MPVKGRTIRVSDPVWARVQAEAKLEGISANAWVQECILSRIVYSMTRRDDDAIATFERIHDCLRELREENR